LLSARSRWDFCCSPRKIDKKVARPLAVIDASCVIALDAVNLLPQLTWLFGRLLLPKAVRTELRRRRSTKDRLTALRREYGSFLIHCDDYDLGAVDVLLTGRTAGKKDRGETEAVVQAAEIGAMVIVDDRRGQRLAEGYALEHHDTVWVLDRLQSLGLLAPRSLRECLQRLKTRGIHLRAANELLRRLGEEEL
jgi:predicted nucleic acid-binding protein